MYTKEDILKKLNAENYYIDINALETFIEEWQIDAIYENTDKVEFYDDAAIVKIRKGISLKSQGYNKEQIAYRLNKTFTDLVPSESEEVESVGETPSESRNVTLNVTNQTLQMLAEAVAQKITVDIKNHIDSSQFAETLVKAGEYKKDNEILATQIKELLEDNKTLAKRIETLEEKKKNFWQKIFSK